MAIPFAAVEQILAAQAKDTHLVGALFPKESGPFGMLLYQLINRWDGRVTIGEEANSIQMVDTRNRQLPSNLRLLLFVLCLLVLPRMLCRRNVSANDGSSGNTLVDAAHSALFYWDARYVGWSHRLLGLRFISEQGNTQRTPLSFLLSLLTIADGVMSTLAKGFDSIGNVVNESARRCSLFGACALCLEDSQLAPSRIPRCGHVFCWDCGIRWLMERPACPLCRVPCLPQQFQQLRH